jgi:hypothetical protein
MDLISSGKVARQLDPLLHHLDRGVNRPAIGVAEDHDERRAQEFDGIFEACEAVIVEEISGETHHEDIARTLIEQEFGRDAAVGATEDRGDWKLCRGARGTVDGKVLLIHLARHVTGIALHQKVERLSRRNRIRVRSGRLASDRRQGQRARGKKRCRARHEPAPRGGLKRSRAMFAVFAHGCLVLRREPHPQTGGASRFGGGLG